MNDDFQAHLSDDDPPLVLAAEIAFRELPNGSPLRSLIHEQFLDYVSALRTKDRRLVALALLGSSDEAVQALGKSLIVERNAVQGDTIPEVDFHKSDQNSPNFAFLDLLILTPKGPELTATMAAFGLSGPSERLGEDSDLWLWDHEGLRVGLASIGTEGNVEAAIELLRTQSNIPIRAAALVGMAAGLPGEVQKGDIVVATWIVAYEFARVTRRKYISRAKPYQADMRSVQKVSQVMASYPDWGQTISEELRKVKQFEGIDRAEKEKLTRGWRPKVRTGVIFAGSRLIEDGSLPKLKEQINDRGLAAEMEGAGFAAACSSLRIPWLVVRGIADYGEQELNQDVAHLSGVRRPKSWQFPSTFVAAAFVRDMVLSGRVPLVENARSRPR